MPKRFVKIRQRLPSIPPYLSDIGILIFLAASSVALTAAAIELINPGLVAHAISPRVLFTVLAASAALSLACKAAERSRAQQLRYAAAGICLTLLSSAAAWYYFETEPARLILTLSAGIVVGSLFLLFSKEEIKKKSMECIFCKIIRGEIPSLKVFEDDDMFAFLDIQPVNLGHTLVVPKEHYQNFSDTPDEVVGKLFTAVKRVAIAAVRAAGAGGYNIGVNTGPAAGQVVFHTHVHVIPRFDGDGLRHWPKKEISRQEMEKAAQKMHDILAR